MKLSEMIDKIHKNAVDHGWWDEARSPGEIIALIHSEWSEAVEEARKGMPMRYKTALFGLNTLRIVPGDGKYEMSLAKPEGAAVEFADGAIRIMDYLGWRGFETESDFSEMCEYQLKLPENVAEAAAYFHQLTSFSLINATGDADIHMESLLCALRASASWIAQMGMDPEEIILEKHHYNQTRPYKHGKKF